MMVENLLECTIREIVERYPETRAVFTGFNLFPTETVYREVAPVLKLKNLLQLRGINRTVFTGLLAGQIEATEQARQLSAVVINKPGGFNFIAQLPCALKLPLHWALQNIGRKLRQEKNLALNYYIWSCGTDILSFADHLQHIQTIDEAPDLIFTTDYLINKNFYDRFLKTGYYKFTPDRPLDSKLVKAGLLDPQGCFNVVAVSPVVAVIDSRRIGNLPLPRTWRDLLRPEYEQQVVLNGCPGDFDDIVLLHIYQQYGDKGIAALKRSVRYGQHPSQMIKSLADPEEDRPPIHIMPDFFAHAIPPARETKVIWLADGALVSPLSFLVKTAKADHLAALIAYFTGPEFGRLCAEAYFPVLNPTVGNRLPPKAGFKWLGWDFIQGQDTISLLAQLNQDFIS